MSIPIIGVAGGSGSGKTTLAKNIIQRSGQDMTLIELDFYYRDLSHKCPEEREITNFDHPDALELDLLHNHLISLTRGEAVDVPDYDFLTHTRAGWQKLHPGKMILLEGTMILLQRVIRENITVSFFIDLPDDIRLLRRIRRDLEERGRTLDFITEQYLNTVRPMYKRFVEPTRDYADHVLDGTKGVSELTNEALHAIQQRYSLPMCDTSILSDLKWQNPSL